MTNISLISSKGLRIYRIHFCSFEVFETPPFLLILNVRIFECNYIKVRSSLRKQFLHFVKRLQTLKNWHEMTKIYEQRGCREFLKF